MKVALIGNMNNNNFSIMRYLRDLGVDAHLILFKDDITKSQSHFAPEYDTWEIDIWKPYIHYLSYVSYKAVLFYPNLFLKKDFIGYDIYIGSGIMPVILNKCNIKTDIFYPYGTGIEGVGDEYTRMGRKDKPFFKRLLYKHLRRLKISAIKESHVCLSSELSLTKQTFDELGIPFQKISIPMVYNRGNIKDGKTNERVLNFKREINKYKYKYFCHVSHLPIKNKLPMLEGFAKFVHSNENRDSVLILLNYGEYDSINLTKKTLKDLGVSNSVIWLDKMPRKEIMLLLDTVDIGFSEFEGTMWGGTGWEFLSCGVPFFHYLFITKTQFEANFNSPMPPIINTNSSDEICKHLISYTKNPEKYIEKGKEMVKWFNRYGGIGLAEQWKNLIEEIYKEKMEYEAI